MLQSRYGGYVPGIEREAIDAFEQWLNTLNHELTVFAAAYPNRPCAPYGVNLILHSSNPRRDQELELAVRHNVPFVITSLGNPAKVVEAVHGYGGVVFSDVIHANHARKAASAGVDGIIAVACGAGGHAGTQTPFSLVGDIRKIWDGPLVLGGAISDGLGLRAAEVLGADLGYIGTRFIATRESMASEEFKRMIVDAGASDIVYTDVVSGTHANFLKPSLERAGIVTGTKVKTQNANQQDEAKVWRDVWSAGQGVALIYDAPLVADLIDRIAGEYRAACSLAANPALFHE